MTYWIVIDDAYNRAEPYRASHIGRVLSEFDSPPEDVHLERTDDVLPARAALERARAAWARIHDQLSLEL